MISMVKTINLHFSIKTWEGDHGNEWCKIFQLSTTAKRIKKIIKVTYISLAPENGNNSKYLEKPSLPYINPHTRGKVSSLTEKKASSSSSLSIESFLAWIASSENSASFSSRSETIESVEEIRQIEKVRHLFVVCESFFFKSFSVRFRDQILRFLGCFYGN